MCVIDRCADRMMSPRLYRSIRVLQKLVREQISGQFGFWVLPFEMPQTNTIGEVF